MPSSQNDIGLFSNVLTERKQEQINLADGLVHTLTPPTGLDGIAMILVLEAQGGDFRYTANATAPTTSTGMLIADGNFACWIPADLTEVKLIRNGTDTGKVNVAYYTFARSSEV